MSDHALTGEDRPGDGLSDLADFLAHALHLENEAADHYEELADAMDAHNNREVAALFERLGGFARQHAAEVPTHAAAHGCTLPPRHPWEFHWPTGATPETPLRDHSHYLMTPHHALTLALEAERLGQQYYQWVATETGHDTIRALATDMAAEESEHVAILEDWLTRYPAPAPGWDDDPDPAHMPE